MARSTFTKEMWLAALAVDGPAFRAAVGAADPNAAVPSCPGWTVSDLTYHLGSLYLNWRQQVVRGVTTPPERVADSEPGSDLLGWWDEQFDSLYRAFEVLDPEMPAWNWAPQAKRAAFWFRRVAHETAIHRWDAQMALGQAEPIEAKLAGDGVAEVLDTFLPAGRRREPSARTGIVVLEATDLEHNWYVRLRGEGIALLDTDTIFDDDDPPARVAASGLVSDIDLALWGRVGFDTLEISGTEPMLEALRIA